jgi:hypothetical protein
MHGPGKTGYGGALEAVSRLGKLAQAGGTSTGVVGVNVARLAAHHRSRKGEGVVRKKRKAVEAVVPARTARVVWFGCPHVVSKLQKSSGGAWSRISSAYAQQKLRQGRVNRDLARSERRWVKPSTGAASEVSVGVPASFPK